MPCVNPVRKREYDRKWFAVHRKERRLWLWSLKHKPCLDCGNSYPPYVMQFDHVRGKKKFKISHWITCSKELVLTEIAKCDLVCANCHAIRTFTRMDLA